MAVTHVEEIPGTGLKFRRRGRTTVRTYNRQFRVFTDDGGTGAITVCTTGGIPRIGDYYETDDEQDTGAYAESISPQQDADNPFAWTVSVDYSSDVEAELTGTGQGNTSNANSESFVANPLLRRAVVSLSTRSRRRVAEKDYSEPTKAYANSAGEKFDPPIEEELYNRVYTIIKNTADFDTDVDDTPYLNAVNETRYAFRRPPANGTPRPVIWWDARTARITRWDAAEREENGVVYYENVIEIERQYPSWDLDVLNQGTKSITRNPTDGSYSSVAAVTEAGVPVSGPILLDEQGFALPNTTVASGITAGNNTVTPKSMENIAFGDRLIIDMGTAVEEEVQVVATTATTFTAVFTFNHDDDFRVLGKPVYITFRPHPIVEFANIPLLNPL